MLCSAVEDLLHLCLHGPSRHTPHLICSSCNIPSLLLSDASQKSPYLSQVHRVEHPPTRWTQSVFWDHQISVPFQLGDGACWTVKLPLRHYINKCQTTSIPPLNLRLFLIHSSGLKCWGWCFCIQRPTVSLLLRNRKKWTCTVKMECVRLTWLAFCCCGENEN